MDLSEFYKEFPEMALPIAQVGVVKSLHTPGALLILWEDGLVTETREGKVSCFPGTDVDLERLQKGA